MDVLKFINEQMEILGIPYEFGEWTSDVTYPYFVGESTEENPETEDGRQDITFILNGFNRGNFSDLENAKEQIKKHFHPVHGLRVQTESGAITAFYGGSFYVPTSEADLRRIQINLYIKEWKGDL